MKKLFLSVTFILFASSIFATTLIDDPIPVLPKTSKELSQFLNSTQSDKVLENEEVANILFTVNDLNQIVVLQVQSNNPDVQDFVKKALNYKKLPSDDLIVGNKYIFEAKF